MAIRPACAGDASFIANTILSSQRGHRPRGWFDVALNRSEAECLDFMRRIAVARHVSWWHVSQFLVAEADGSPAASLCAMPAGGTAAGARAAIAEVAEDMGLDVAEPAAIWKRGAYTRACWIQGGEDDWLIEHAAALPSHRGRGLVQALIEHGLEKGRAAGFRRASISFLIGNEPAERAYAKAGFTFAEEKRDPDFQAIIGAPGFRRFARSIQGVNP